VENFGRIFKDKRIKLQKEKTGHITKKILAIAMN